MTSILIVEDEERIARFVQKGLEAAGYICARTDSGKQAVAMLLAGEFDLAILDRGLPDIDGFEVLRQVRGQGNNTPIIMLTADSATESVVAGLEGGANDYMSKPFPFDVLLARVRLRLQSERVEAEVGLGKIVHNGAELDLRARTVTIGGKFVELSAREFALAEEFFKHPGQVLSREQLLSRVWGYDFDPGSNVVDVYVRYLRSKLGSDSIETVRGMGYKLM